MEETSETKLMLLDTIAEAYELNRVRLDNTWAGFKIPFVIVMVAVMPGLTGIALGGL